MTTAVARGLMALVLGASAPGSWALTQAEAECVLKDKKIVFIGDSVLRFQYYGLNNFLATGKLRKDEYGSSEGYGDDSTDYDTFDTWTDWKRFSFSKSTHRMHCTMKFDDFETEFFFIQNVWFDDDETDGENSMEDLADRVGGADIIVFNAGWWHLKEGGPRDCGDDWDSTCESDYKSRLAESIDRVLGEAKRLALFRATTCCGESGDDSWIRSIEKINDIAEDMIESAGMEFVDVYPLYGEDDLDDTTFDRRHANVEMTHVFDEMIFDRIDKALGLGCIGGGGGDDDDDDPPETTYAPTRAPTTPPTREPSRRPTTPVVTYAPTREPTHEPSRAPTYEPTREPTHDPTREPTLSPTPQPSRDPTRRPALEPTVSPTPFPSYEPTRSPTANPTRGPTPEPSREPTRRPTASPTPTPTTEPKPTTTPTPRPTPAPTMRPTPKPTVDTCANGVQDLTETDVDCGGDKCGKCVPGQACQRNADCLFAISACVEGTCLPHPTAEPTAGPSSVPTRGPTAEPTARPTRAPTTIPGVPTLMPTVQPTLVPSVQPTPPKPTLKPTPVADPTPTRRPTAAPAAVRGTLSLDGLTAADVVAHAAVIKTALAAKATRPETIDHEDVTLSVVGAARRRLLALAVDYTITGAEVTQLRAAADNLASTTPGAFDEALQAAAAATSSTEAEAVFAGVTTETLTAEFVPEGGGGASSSKKSSSSSKKLLGQSETIGGVIIAAICLGSLLCIGCLAAAAAFACGDSDDVASMPKVQYALSTGKAKLPWSLPFRDSPGPCVEHPTESSMVNMNQGLARTISRQEGAPSSPDDEEE